MRRKSYENIDGAVSHAFIAENVREDTWYLCEVRDKYDTYYSIQFHVLAKTQDVAITGQPEDFAGPIGATASFTVTAEGDGLTYQWQYRSSKDGKWYNAKVDGANTSTMRIGVTDARNGMKFRCKVTDAYGNQAISDAAALRVG